MRTLFWGLAWPLLAGLISCSSGSKTPANPVDTAEGAFDFEQSALPGGDTMPGMLGIAALGGYHVDLTLGEAPSATVTPWRTASANDDIYFLSVGNFLRPNSLRVTGITRTASTIDIDYTFTHPFAAPTNLAGPATAANRADLGIAARLVFLMDLPSGSPAPYTYFGGEAIANTALVVGADGYFKPGPLLPGLGLTANTFPYKLIVDEGAGTAGNREGIGNGSNGAGNYKPTSGWQGDNIAGPNGNNGWTGFGMLHQGQSATNVLRLDTNALQSQSSFSFNTAVLAKYIDSRGGTTAAQKRANRLPSNPENVANFVYRMPYGAIDAERVRTLGETGGLLPNNPLSTSTLRLYVRDADARATVSSRTDLKDDADPKTVPAGTEGVPTVTVDIPGVTSAPAVFNLVDDDSAFGGDAAADSGLAFDELYFEGLVQNSASSGQSAGDVVGMVKVVDPENNIDRSAWEFILDPNLAPQAANSLPVVTYQRFRVTLGGSSNTPPTATVALVGGPNPTVNSGGALDFEVTAEDDDDGDPVLYDIDVDDDGTFEATGVDPAGVPPPAVPLYSGIAPVNGGATPQARQARVRYYDAASIATPTVVLLDYTVNPAGPNDPPTATISLLSNSIPSGGQLTYQLDAENDPDGDTVLYAIDYDYTGVFTPDVTSIDPAPAPSTLHVSAAQNNPGVTTLNRTTRIQYSDGINPPITVDLNYDLGPSTCASQSLAFNFDANGQGWVKGTDFAYGPSQPNGDQSNWGHFEWGCNATETETRSAGAITGEYWTSGGDGSGCSFLYDYGRQANYNIMSPFINVPTICTPNSLQVRFNMILWARSGAQMRLYVSTDLGATWGTAVWTQNANDTEQILTNTTVSLPDALGGQTILLRYEFVDTVDSTYSLPNPYNNSSNSVAMTLDNVEISAGAASAFGTNPPTFPCQPRTLTFDFTTSGQGWIEGDLFSPPLPNTDLNFGWGQFGWSDCAPANSGTLLAVQTASGSAISGSAIGVTSDGSFCSFEDDWGGDPLYNIVSPRILIPPICSGQVNLIFNAYLNVDDSNYFGTFDGPVEDGADTGVQVRMYFSTDNGVTWGTPMWSQNATLAGQTWLNVTFPVTGLAGNPSGLRLRFEFDGTFTDPQQDDPNDPFGFWVDNIRFVADDTSSIFTFGS